jgi:hypothetical protein
MKTIVTLIQKNGKVLLIILVLFTAFFSLRLGKIEMKEDEETFISKDNPVLKQYREFQKTFESNEGVIVAFETPDLFSAKELKYIENLQAKLENLTGVSEVNSLINADNINGFEDGMEINPIIDMSDLTADHIQRASEQVKDNPLYEGVFISKDHQVTALIIKLPGMFNGGCDSIQKVFYSQLTELIQTEEKNTGRRLYVGGDIVTDASIENLMEKDLSLLFPLSLILSAFILFFFYRKLMTTIVPLIPVLAAIVWVLGLKGWTGVPMTPISITLFPLIMVIGLANSIHIINHYKRIRPFESDNSVAITKTLESVLKPCFLAAFTTAVGFASLSISDVVGIKQMGLFAAFGIMSAFFISIVIIPFALRYTKAFNKSTRRESKSNFLTPVIASIDRLNHKYPLRIALIFAALAIVMLVFIPKIKVEGSMASFARENTRLRQDINYLDEHLSGINAYELILKGKENSFKDPEILKKMDFVVNQLSKSPEVLKTFSVADMVKTINKALHSDSSAYYSIPFREPEIAQYLFLYEISGGEELNNFVNVDYSVARITIRTIQMHDNDQKAFIKKLNQLSSKTFPELKIETTGSGILMNHINENLISTQIESILTALGIILLLMFVMFGFKGGLLSILPNLLPILFFMGLMGIFGIDLNMATSIIASVTIGIVVDDTIHFFFGYKKEMKLLNKPAVAITNTIQKVGAALCITSLILTMGFGIMVFSSSKFIGDFGIMSASAIAAALFADLFISPIVLLKSKLFIVH